jgi:hypothetical protein
MGDSIDAHYARVSPDITAPLVTIAPLIDRASVEQHSSTLVADFSCQEPGGLGSGVASCVGRDDEGEVADGDALDTSTIGTHSLTVTAVDKAGNERSWTIRVRTTDDGGALFEQTFTVELTDVIKLSPAEVAENQPAGTTVGRLTGTPPGSDIGFGPLLLVAWRRWRQRQRELRPRRF